jgi:outer membrane protein assembly factor BamD (BamD/ComL family)
MNKLLCGLCVLTAATLVGCSSAQSDWNTANTQGTVAAYQTFLTQHPNDPHDAQARQRIATIQDDQAWMAAQNANTVASYQQYLASQPMGSHAQEAQEKITGLQRAAAWQDAKAADTSTAIQDFLQKYPTGAEADEAKAMLAQFNYRVSLGTYRSSKTADRMRERLQDKFGKDLQSVVVMPPKGKSRDYHVASAAMTHDQAMSACKMVRKGGQRCEVMKEESPGAG